MPLFHVQDSRRPGYVVAESHEEAIEKWRFAMKDESGREPEEQPGKIVIICEDSDLIVDFVWRGDIEIESSQNAHKHDWRRAFDGTEVCPCGAWR